MTIPRLKKHPSHSSSSLPQNLRGIFAGSGTLLNHPEMGPHLLSLASRRHSASGTAVDPSSITLLYLGTPSYDLPEKRLAQTSWYVERGCRVVSLDVVEKAPTTAYMKECVEGADIILVSGGNTSFAMRRWRRLGLDGMMREAVVRRGVVMAGGSAGAICWWSGGHSDSIDPDSYKEAKLSSFSSHSDIDDDEGNHNHLHNPSEGPSEGPPDESSEEPSKEWDYIRVDGLSILPGLCCPHHDRIQSNGILRAHDFDDMMLRHPTEVGIGIDHNAAFLVDGEDYRVIYPEHDEAMRVGSVILPEETFSEDRKGVPGVWIKEVVMNGKMSSCRLCPREGKIGELLKIPVRVESSVRHMKVAALENPDDGPMRMSYPGFGARSFFGESGVGVGKEEFLEMVRGVASGVEEGESGEEEGSEENDGKEIKAEEVIGAN